MVGEEIKAIISVERKVFHNGNDWGIYSVSVDKVKSGNPQTGKYKNNITIKGNMPELQDGMQYKLVAKEVNDKRFGLQYEIKSIASLIQINEDDEVGKKKYLCKLFTEKQVEAMYEALDDPFEVLKNNDAAKLVQVKGCGVQNAIRWVKKFKDNYSFSKIYIELEKYELTHKMISKLMDRYNNPDLVISKVKDNPYTLSEVPGIGWKKADEIAQKGGVEPYCIERIESYMCYYLENTGNEGRSYISPQELMDAIVENIGEEVPDLNVSEAIRDLGDKLWYNKDKTKIGLMKYRRLEENIANEFKRLLDAENTFEYSNWEKVVKSIEQEQGWEYTEEQRNGIFTALEKNVVIIEGKAGCVDCDTEFFDGKRWKKISEYEQGDKVLQYNKDGTANLVEPIRYIKQPSDKLWHFETKYGLDQCLSDEHECYYITSKGNLFHKPFKKIREKQQGEGNGFTGRFITTFDACINNTGIDLTDYEIRIMVAIMADGSFYYNKTESSNVYNKVRFHLKKDRKKARLLHLLTLAGVKYKIKRSSANEYIDVYFQASMRIKHFPEEWYNCSKHQIEVIAQEVMYWDGSFKNVNNYSTTNKNDADFVQWVFTNLGYRTSISVDDRRGRVREINNKKYITKSITYTVSYTKRNLTSMTVKKDRKTKITEYKTKDGYEYCFTVPSHMLVLRRNNKIFITGNCGKTTIANAFVRILENYSCAQAALSGRAGARLAETTGEEGFTIHRLLGFPNKNENDNHMFAFNEDNPLPYDIIIVDEVSMIGGRLFLNLLRAIKDGAKLIMLGDVGQLPPIGECNVAADIIASEYIPTVSLTQIHRQAAKSAIITDSIKVREGIQIIDKDWVGLETRGELQDFTIDCFSDKSNTYYKVLQHYSAELEKVESVLDIQVITPVKNQGDCCTYSLNNAIQELYNPKNNKSDKEIVGYSNGKPYVLRVGDKVINRKNNYKVSSMDGESVGLFNGDIGIIHSISDDGVFMEVDFTDRGRYFLDKDVIDNLELAYAITCHSFQGSQAERVIVALDYSSFILLSREWVYTAVTRAQKHCTLVCQASALRYAIGKENVNDKTTHLVECLDETFNPKIIF